MGTKKQHADAVHGLVEQIHFELGNLRTFASEVAEEADVDPHAVQERLRTIRRLTGDLELHVMLAAHPEDT